MSLCRALYSECLSTVQALSRRKMRGRIFWVLGASGASILFLIFYYLHGTHDPRLRLPQSSPINTDNEGFEASSSLLSHDSSSAGTDHKVFSSERDSSVLMNAKSSHLKESSDNDSFIPILVPQDQDLSKQVLEVKEEGKAVIGQETDVQGQKDAQNLEQSNQIHDPNSLASNPSHQNSDLNKPGQGRRFDLDSQIELDANIGRPPNHVTQKPVDNIARNMGQSAEQEAINRLRRQMEIERKEVDKWKKEQQQDIAEERRKIQEAQHSLLEEKIRFQKEIGEMMEEIKNGVVRGNLASLPTTKPTSAPLPPVANLAPVDPSQWLGLNNSYVQLTYPQILLNPDYKLQSFFAPNDPLAAGMQGNPKSLNDLTAGQAEERFYQLVSETHMVCNNIQRLGNLGDGGWDICVAEPYVLRPGCIVYSFGINFDFSFDDSMADVYGCQVRAFDPSMNTGDHIHAKQVYFYQLGLGPANTVNSQGWRLQTLGSIMKKLNHLQTPIDVLKLDIEHNEWDCFHTMLKERVLRNVKQLIFEMHTPEVYTVRRPSTKEDFIRMAAILRGLEEQGFRRYHFHYNPFGMYTSTRTGKSRTCCYELYYLNVHYLS